MLYISGQIGLDPETMELAGDVAEQARQTLTNIGHLLRVLVLLTFLHFILTFPPLPFFWFFFQSLFP